MSQTLNFNVDSAVDQLVDMVATVDGEPVTVKVPALEVHLSSPDGMMFPVLRFRTDIDAARAEFPAGTAVTLTIAAAE